MELPHRLPGSPHRTQRPHASWGRDSTPGHSDVTRWCSDPKGWLCPGGHVKTGSLPKLLAYSPRRRFSLSSLSSHQHPVTSWEPGARRLRHRATPHGFAERALQKRAFCTTGAKSFVLSSPSQSPCSRPSCPGDPRGSQCQVTVNREAVSRGCAVHCTNRCQGSPAHVPATSGRRALTPSSHLVAGIGRLGDMA